ncbi:MAG: shikimate kinase [Candidatus Omnitrophica bacterium]|nr:shikimate kinase [Candidatus Omnitrophota bacterium]
MNVILIGFMGTGKTTVGKRLAKRLGWEFVDVDQLIEARAKIPIARIFAERGEPVFRRMERRCIGRVIHGHHQVIATGGGAVVDPQNRARLRASGLVVCLTARPAVILSRVGRKPAMRPMLEKSHANPLSRIRSLMQERAAAYAKADLTIDTSGLSVDETVERIWEHVSPYLCKSWQYLLDHAGALAHRYGGKYIVVVDDRIVACGDTQLDAYQKASHRLDDKREAGIYYIPLAEESLTAL